MPEITLYQILAQAMGFLGTITVVIGMQQKKYKHIAMCKIGNEFLSAIHYLMLGGYTAVAANFISCVTNGCYYFRIKKGKSTRPFQIAFTILFVIIGALSWHGPISICVILAKVFSSLSLSVKEPKWVRLINLLYNPLWLVYDVYVGSIAGVITDVLIITSTAIAIIRLDLKKKPKETKGAGEICIETSK